MDGGELGLPVAVKNVSDGVVDVDDGTVVGEPGGSTVVVGNDAVVATEPTAAPGWSSPAAAVAGFVDPDEPCFPGAVVTGPDGSWRPAAADSGASTSRPDAAAPTP